MTDMALRGPSKSTYMHYLVKLSIGLASKNAIIFPNFFFSNFQVLSFSICVYNLAKMKNLEHKIPCCVFKSNISPLSLHIYGIHYITSTYFFQILDIFFSKHSVLELNSGLTKCPQILSTESLSICSGLQILPQIKFIGWENFEKSRKLNFRLSHGVDLSNFCDKPCIMVSIFSKQCITYT